MKITIEAEVKEITALVKELGQRENSKDEKENFCIRVTAPYGQSATDAASHAMSARTTG
ncbi:hypothetical protein Q5O14_07735 [Eubacteriaceae bacterium ES2]|nr:hypothetical protein Q5O14_07735 [Eubacteriaceae bacterium ES2]